MGQQCKDKNCTINTLFMRRDQRLQHFWGDRSEKNISKRLQWNRKNTVQERHGVTGTNNTTQSVTGVWTSHLLLLRFKFYHKPVTEKNERKNEKLDKTVLPSVLKSAWHLDTLHRVYSYEALMQQSIFHPNTSSNIHFSHDNILLSVNESHFRHGSDRMQRYSVEKWSWNEL